MTQSMTFEKKKLTPPKRVCLRLKEARDAAKISLDELASRTKLNKRHLVALEECRFDDIPYAPIYQKNFIRSYAQAVGVAAEPLLEQFMIEENPLPKKAAVVPVRHHRLQDFPYLLRTIAVASAVIIFFVYLGLQVKAIVDPPTLTLYTPEDGYVTANSTIVIRGQTEKESTVLLNGKEIQTNNSGLFQETVTLANGINTLTVSAHKRHGKEVSETRHVIVEEQQQFSLNR